MTEKQNVNQMTNSHILVQDFDYYEPATLDEALKTRKKYGRKAQFMAGGTHLLTMLKMERDYPEAIISLLRIASLHGVSTNPQGELVIGAATTIYELRFNALVQNNYPALAEACAAFGSTQIQVMGSIGGNICNGSPASDTIPALMIYDARLVIQGTDGEQQMPLEKFLLGPGKTALKEDQVLAAIILPPAPEKSTSVFVKVSRVAADLAKASIAIMIEANDNKITACKIALGSVAPTVMRAKKAEASLTGKPFAQELLIGTGKLVSEEISPIDDIRSNAWYRRQLCGAMTVDALNMAWQKLNNKQAPSSQQVNLPPYQDAGTQHHNIKAGDEKDITLTINGKKQRLWVKPNELLLNVLRDRLDLKGAKYGCGLGECGACTVMMDGKALLSCLVLASAAEGHDIVSVEGLQKPNGELDTLQKDFLDEAAFQCGYCTPGFLMTTKALLNDMPHPSEDEIRDYLKGNRCRCTGYASIMRAVVRSVQRQK